METDPIFLVMCHSTEPETWTAIGVFLCRILVQQTFSALKGM